MNTILDRDIQEGIANSIIGNEFELHKQKWNYLSEENHLCLVAKLGLKPYKDGNQWCILWGDNIQEGICGFGDTVNAAISDFNTNFYNERIEVKSSVE